MGKVELSVDGYRIEPLGPQTWDAFADLAERHNGVWGGCWCAFFHCYPDPPERKKLGNREFKRHLVLEDHAHAALVFDGAVAIAWAEYGPVEELPNIHHRKEWERGVSRKPDYRITCLFVDRSYRRKGTAAVAVRGALALIAAAGGGLVESYPHDVPPGKKTSSSFLYNATLEHVRAARVRLRATQGQGQLRDEQGGHGRLGPHGPRRTPPVTRPRGAVSWCGQFWPLTSPSGIAAY